MQRLAARPTTSASSAPATCSTARTRRCSSTGAAPSDLYRYAADPELAHRPAWKAFYGWAAKAPAAVTIWHETYAVPAGGHESLYAGPADFGLAALDGVVPVGQRGERARERMTG